MPKSPVLRRPRPRAVALVGAAVLILAALAASISASRAATPHARAHADTAIGFSHAVIVDQQRPGFEPDVKVAPDGGVFTSVPFGFSTTQSFLWSSRDGGNSYQFVPGTVGSGKPATCVGGGDTDLFIDPGNALYFTDLQGLTNISMSKSTDGGATFSTNCAAAPNAPDDRMWLTGTGSSAAGNLNLYQDYDAVNGSLPNAGNQLVETVSHDGTTFTPVINTNAASTGCAGTGAYDCVTNNEGISGNQVTDPATGNVFIAHTTSNSAGVQVSEGKITQGTPTTATWTESPNLDQALCADPGCTDPAGNPEELAGENFASIARDSAGYLYVTFTAGPLDHARQLGRQLRRPDHARADLRGALAAARRVRSEHPDVVGAAADHRGRRQRGHQHLPVDHRRLRRPRRRGLVPRAADQSERDLRERLGHLHPVRRFEPDQRRVDRADGPEPRRPRQRAQLRDHRRDRGAGQARPDLHERSRLRHRR